MVARSALLPMKAQSLHTTGISAWGCPSLPRMTWKECDSFPALPLPELSTMLCWQWRLCWMNKWMQERTNEWNRANSKFTFNFTWVNLLCLKGVWVCSWSNARIHSFSCKGADQQQTQEIPHAKREEQIRLFLKEPFSDSPPKGSQNALVVSCPTGKIKLEGWTSWAPCVYLRVSHPKGSILGLAPVVGNRKTRDFPTGPRVQAHVVAV